MEDEFSLDIDSGGRESFFASVFDGHHGKRAAQFASKHLHSTISGMVICFCSPGIWQTDIAIKSFFFLKSNNYLRID